MSMVCGMCTKLPSFAWASEGGAGGLGQTRF